MSKDEKTRSKLGTGEVEGEKIVIREKADGVPFTEYAFMSKNINLLTDRVKRERHPSDAYIFTVMCSMLDIRTGICHAKQKDIVTATGLSKSEVSKAVKRLSTPLPPEVSSCPRPAGFIPAGLPELIRQWKDGGLAGYALHPDIVSIGNAKYRAKILWKQAEQQAIDKANKAAQAAIQNAAESSSLAAELDDLVSENDIDFL